MKQKTIIHYQKKGGDFFAKGAGTRTGASFILLAELPGNDVLYAATIESGLSKRYADNQAEKLKELCLVKKKGSDEKLLQILLDDETTVELRKENYCLLFYLPGSESGLEDYMLVFNYPGLIGSGVHFQFFPDDERVHNAIALFWMAKDFIRSEEE